MTERSIVRAETVEQAAGRSWVLPTILLICGGIARLAWVAIHMRGKFATGEIANVAIAFARTGVLANPFQMGPEPTAHVLPIPPMFAGVIYRVFGIHSAIAEFLLELSSIALVLGSFLFLYLIFATAGMPRWARLTALAIACLVPFNFIIETIDFRIWEGALATFLAFGYIWLLTVIEVGMISTRVMIGMGILAALVFFISPPLGLACYICSFLVVIERFNLWKVVAALTISASALAMVIAPWAIRNERVMGAPVLLRSNFGLELALANHPRATGSLDELLVFRDRLQEIHPNNNPAAYARLRAAGGEVQYAHRLGAIAEDWITAHPKDFATLCLRHLKQYFFPPAWLWNIYSPHANAKAQARIHAFLSITALFGLAVAFVTSARNYRYIAIMFVVPVLPYVILQPVPRYRYIVFGLSVFLAVSGFARLIAVLRARRFFLSPLKSRLYP